MEKLSFANYKKSKNLKKKCNKCILLDLAMKIHIRSKSDYHFQSENLLQLFWNIKGGGVILYKVFIIILSEW